MNLTCPSMPFFPRYPRGVPKLMQLGAEVMQIRNQAQRAKYLAAQVLGSSDS
jgi:hypothetical protein